VIKYNLGMSSRHVWLTVQEAASLTGYDPEHIRRLMRAGRIKARKFSIVWQVSRESLVDYIAQAQSTGKKRGPKKTNLLNRERVI
jgi:excisionase family DNA binding protein